MQSRRRFLRGVSGGVVATGAALAAGRTSLAARAGEQVIAPTLSAANLKPTGPLDEAYWWKVRSQFNILDGMTFMNNGTEGPVPRVVLEANERFFREIAENPSNNYRREEVDVVRGEVARFVGANADEIALTRSTTEGMNIFTHGLDWKAGDEVIYCSHEHGGGIGCITTMSKRARHQAGHHRDPVAAAEHRSDRRPLREGDHAAHQGHHGEPHDLRDRTHHAGQGARRPGASPRPVDLGGRRPSAGDDGSRPQGDERRSLRRRRPEVDDVRHRHRRVLHQA